MNIAVVLRLAPDLRENIKLDSDGIDLDRDSVSWTINEWDDQALEQAILLKEATGATVTAVAVRSPDIKQLFRTAYGRGVDRGVVVGDGDIARLDSPSAAGLLAAAMREIESDLVLIGVQTPSDALGQVGPLLAAELGWPHVNVVIDVQAGEREVRVRQEYAGGRAAVLDVTLPAVLGIQSSPSPPRYASVSRMLQVMSKSPDELTVHVDKRPSPTLVALRRPKRAGGATMIEGTPEEIAARLVEVLEEQGVLEEA